MTTYVLSEHPTFWDIHRYADHRSGEVITETASGLRTEEEAMALVMKEAKFDLPSQIIRINMKGDSHVIAKFN